MLFGSVTDADLAKVRARTMAQRKAQYKQRMMHKSLVSPVLFGNCLQTLYHNHCITSYEHVAIGTWQIFRVRSQGIFYGAVES